MFTRLTLTFPHCFLKAHHSFNHRLIFTQIFLEIKVIILGHTVHIMDGWVDDRMDGLIDGMKDRWINGWMG